MKVYSLDAYRYLKQYVSKEEAKKYAEITSQEQLDDHFRSIEQVKVETQSGLLFSSNLRDSS